MLARPFFRVLLAWSPLLNLTVNAITFITVLRLIQAGYDPVHIGLVETAVGVCGLLGAVVAPAVVDRCRPGCSPCWSGGAGSPSPYP